MPQRDELTEGSDPAVDRSRLGRRRPMGDDDRSGQNAHRRDREQDQSDQASGHARPAPTCARPWSRCALPARRCRSAVCSQHEFRHGPAIVGSKRVLWSQWTQVVRMLCARGRLRRPARDRSSRGAVPGWQRTPPTARACVGKSFRCRPGPDRRRFDPGTSPCRLSGRGNPARGRPSGQPISAGNRRAERGALNGQ